MPCHYHLLTHPGIQSLRPYIPGKSIDELAQEKGISNIIKLASNENPLGCSPLAQQALAELNTHQLARYPSPNNHPLRAKLAEQLNIDTSKLCFSNGSESIFGLLLNIFALGQNKHMLIHQYSFIAYAIQAQTMGIPIITIELLQNYHVNMDAIITACLNNDVAILFLANPNNPTGIMLEDEQVHNLLSKISPSTIVVLDEAYHEYAHPKGSQASLDLQKKFPNLVITRTFSKLYGLAALRLGYAIAHPQIIDLLLRIQPPFAVNQAALVAAKAALDDKLFIEKTRQCNQEGMTQIIEGLTQLNLSYFPSRANFITFDCAKNAEPIDDKLLEDGIIVRPLTPYGLPNHLRVSIGTHTENKQFLTSLSKAI